MTNVECIPIKFLMKSHELKMVITDLDNTLLRNNRSIGKRDYTTLRRLGERKIIRVIATGRSGWRSFRKMSPKLTRLIG